MTKLNRSEFYTLIRNYHNQSATALNMGLKELKTLEDEIYIAFRDNYHDKEDIDFLESFGLNFIVAKDKLYDFPHFKFYLNNQFIFKRYDMRALN